jgi:hypothetical protein
MVTHGVIGMRHRLANFLGTLILVVPLTSCIDVGLDDAVEQAVDAITRAQDRIAIESADWQYTLQNVTQGLAKDARDLIQGDLTNLLGRIEGAVPSVIGCTVDLLSSKAVEGLEKIKANLTHETYESPPPSVCRYVPNAIDLGLSASTRQSMDVFGYDWDSDAPIRVLHTFKNGDEPVELDILTKDTAYHALLAIGEVPFGPNSDKLRIEGLRGMLAELKVIQKPPPECIRGKEDNAQHDPVTVWPSLVRGDAEFFGNGPLIHVGFSVQNDQTRLLGRLGMDAQEEIPHPFAPNEYLRGDTYADGSTEPPFVLYQAPPGFQITSWIPSGATWEGHTTRDTNPRESQRFTGDGSTMLREWEITGDIDGVDVGVDRGTRATAFFAPFKVFLAEIPGNNGCVPAN